ncbi:AAA family ATPase [Paraferrimonas sedimenticola]|uniref:Nuclease SbcCD subunit C n=1 Tax=Paraferrimonas sedimenticola TaxID=375674 RepID=A0AA37RWP6_9GAMM|nr:SMC family ATPase [Paraferrimonas sedimenticola]GLP96648.1 nuclease SbcCD subunit C [Paraferrimonas sedimenticola]
MRPIALTLQAFGPFADRQVLDFTKLGDNPLFLICGATGAGKSSLLDAMCFALYGATSSKERDPAHMRCDYAQANLLTQVEFEFAIGAQRYRIERSPTQDKPKQRGEGVTEHKTQALLIQIHADGSETLLEASRASEVSKRCQELLGLDVEQFRQVMVLPQGKFRELLLADSSQREKIFSQLFQTQIYRRLEDSLKEQARAVNKQYHELKQQQVGLLASGEYDSEQALEEAIAALVPECEQLQQQAQACQTQATAAAKTLADAEQLAQLIARRSQTLAQSEQLAAQQDDIAQAQTRLELGLAAQSLASEQQAHQQQTQLVQSLAEQASSLQTQLVSAERAVEDAKRALAEGAELETQIHNYQRALQNNAELQQRWQRLAPLKQAATKAEAAHLESVRQKTELSEQLQTLSAGLSSAQSQQDALQPLVAKQGERQNQWHRWQQLQRGFESISELRGALSHKQAELTQARGQYRQLQETAKAADQNAKGLQLTWHQQQAASLAQELADDQPCPVCGSADHPNPAVSEQALISQQALEVAQQQAQASRDQLAVQGEIGAKLKTEAESLEEQIEKILATSPELAQLTEAALAQGLEHAQREAEASAQAAVQLEQLTKSLQADRQALDLAQQQQTAADSAERQAEQAWRSAQQTWQAALAEIPEDLRSEQALISAGQQLTTQLNATQARWSALQQAAQTAEQTLSAAQGQLQQVNQQQVQAQAQLQHTQTAWTQALEESQFSDESAYTAARLSSEQMQALRHKVDQYQAKSAEVAGALAQMEQAIDGRSAPDLAELSERNQQANAALIQAQEAHQSSLAKLDLAKALQRKLCASAERMAEVEKDYALVGTLSEVASGQSGDKVNLQRFVLSVLLDDVLISASERFYTMSKGRYRLLRKTERAKGNKASGLELEVEDGYSGLTRGVATLSGGESFMAALSLALGLSDVVQSYAGGIQLDTLFIDEGFGSLDPESLDLAVNTLIDLQSRGRTIGIISHVSELKETMALRLEVDAGKEGSRLRMVGVVS